MITMTPQAQSTLSRFIQQSDQPVVGLRISISDGGCAGYQYAMQLETQVQADDWVEPLGDGLNLLVAPDSAPLLQGCVIDYEESLEGSGFRFDNPSAKKACNCGKSFAA